MIKSVESVEQVVDVRELDEQELELVSGGARVRYFSPGGDVNTYVNNIQQLNLAIGSGNFQANGASIYNG